MVNDSQVVVVSVKRAGKIATYEVHGGRALIGSASHCDVRLSPADAAPEQLRVEVQNGELCLQPLAAASAAFLCRVDSAPLVRTTVLHAESVVQLGQTELQARLALGPDRKQRANQDDGWPMPVRLLGLGLIGVGLYFALQDPPLRSPLDQAVEQPPLFGAPISECPPRGDASADYHAGRLIRDAHLKSERAPFFPREAVAAVTRYEQAAACFKQLGLHGEAKAAERGGSLLRRVVADDFHLRHVRLERLLSIKRYAAAQRELQVLQDFVTRKDSPYAQWLSAVQRELSARFATAPENG